MSATNTLETGLLNLILNNIDLANIGDASGLQNSATDGSLWVALHTSDPTDTGSYAGEISYTGYARIAVARNPGSPQWTVASGAAENAAAITFGLMTAGAGGTVTHVSIGTAVTGGTMLLVGTCSSLAVGVGVTPSFAAGALDITCD